VPPARSRASPESGETETVLGPFHDLRLPAAIARRSPLPRAQVSHRPTGL